MRYLPWVVLAAIALTLVFIFPGGLILYAGLIFLILDN